MYIISQSDILIYFVEFYTVITFSKISHAFSQPYVFTTAERYIHFLIFCKANFNQFFFFICLHISCNLKCISVSIANHEATNNYLHLLFCGNAIWCISTLQSTWVCQLVPSSNGNTRVVVCFLCLGRGRKLDLYNDFPTCR